MEPDPDDLDENRSWDRAHGLYAFLEQACRQIGRLDIYSFARLNHATDVVLEHWLDHCPAGMTRVLQVQRYCATLGFIGPPPTNWRLQLAYIEHAESVVESLSVLQLRDTLIPWTSLAYHNRIDLRLYYGSSPATVKISVSQFANILNSSPELTRLQLEGLEITPSDGWNATMAVHLVHLEVLYLNDLRGESYKLLASIILLSDCLNDLSASLHIRGVPGSQEPQRTTDLIRDFFRDINVKTLMCSEEHLRSIENPQWAWSLPTTVVSLDTLVLTNFGLLGETALQAMLYGNQTNVDEPKALKQIVPHLPHLFMDRCKVNIEELNIIVSAHGVRDINLRECTIYNTENSGYPEDMVALRNELLTAFPELICTVWSDDIAAEWPRCKIYD
ncbi:hypothetical protein FRC12_014368 [Ceratobasidium sp. 428]|nr:hypothetical protein FRC12_014368 [Ceratobasidium sp. 428]